jgi:hypothetical protein
MEKVWRIATGQTSSPWQLKIGGCVMVGWFLMDLAQFVDWAIGLTAPALPLLSCAR